MCLFLNLTSYSVSHISYIHRDTRDGCQHSRHQLPNRLIIPIFATSLYISRKTESSFCSSAQSTLHSQQNLHQHNTMQHHRARYGLESRRVTSAWSAWPTKLTHLFCQALTSCSSSKCQLQICGCHDKSIHLSPYPEAWEKGTEP